MIQPVQQNHLALDRLIAEKSTSSTLSEKIWTVVSVILFPIGLYRVTCHLVAKYIFSPYIVGSSSSYVRLLHNHKEAIELANDTFLICMSDREVALERKAIKTKDGLTLDGLHIIHSSQRDLPVEEQKYLIYILPAKGIWQQKISELLDLSKATNRNILCVNYRATGASKLVRPSSFEDLFCDIESSLASLTGVLKDNTVLYAHSIGCATALHLADKCDMRAVVQNTFHSLQDLAELYSRPLINTILKNQLVSLQKEQELPITDRKTGESRITKLSLLSRVLYSAKDAFFSLPHLVVRVSYFCLSFLDNLVSCKLKLALLDLKEIGRTALIDLILTITGIVAIPFSLFSSRINRFNGSLKCGYLKRPALVTFLQSKKFIWLAKKILETTGWTANNTEKALRIGKERLFIVQVKHDRTIPYEFSLAKALRESDPSFTIHEFMDHPLEEDKDHHGFMASPALIARHATDKELLEFLSH